MASLNQRFEMDEQERNSFKIAYPKDLIQEEIDKIKKHLPRSCDMMTRILVLARPIVEVVLLECGVFDVKKPANVVGKRPIPATTLMLIMIISTLDGIGSYRQAERSFNAHPAWLKALGLEKAPSYAKLSTFCKEKGPAFFKQFFYKLTGLLLDFGLIDNKQAAIIDSAPVEACMNFARANVDQRIDKDRLQAFFETIDFKPAIEMLGMYSRHPAHGKKIFTDEMLVKFLCFQHVCGFLSRSQAIACLKYHPDLGPILGFPSGKIVSDYQLKSFEKWAPPISVLMTPLVDQMTDFFDEHVDYDENEPLVLFFWTSEN